MLTIKHLDTAGNEQFDIDRLNSVYVFAIQKLDQIIECKQAMDGENHRFKWSFKRVDKGFDLTIQDI